MTEEKYPKLLHKTYIKLKEHNIEVRIIESRGIRGTYKRATASLIKDEVSKLRIEIESKDKEIKELKDKLKR